MQKLSSMWQKAANPALANSAPFLIQIGLITFKSNHRYQMREWMIAVRQDLCALWLEPYCTNRLTTWKTTSAAK